MLIDQTMSSVDEMVLRTDKKCVKELYRSQPFGRGVDEPQILEVSLGQIVQDTQLNLVW